MAVLAERVACETEEVEAALEIFTTQYFVHQMGRYCNERAAGTERR